MISLGSAVQRRGLGFIRRPIDTGRTSPRGGPQIRDDNTAIAPRSSARLLLAEIVAVCTKPRRRIGSRDIDEWREHHRPWSTQYRPKPQADLSTKKDTSIAINQLTISSEAKFIAWRNKIGKLGSIRTIERIAGASQSNRESRRSV
jgi:hypothetical protein